MRCRGPARRSRGYAIWVMFVAAGSRHDADMAYTEMNLTDSDVSQSVESELPTGTVTFLLTDIEGSTKLWEAGADEAAVSVARHYELLDAAIALHGGVRPVEQGEGDSVVGAFSRASDAVAAALDVQRAFAQEAVARRWRSTRAHGAPHRRDSFARCRQLLRSDDHPVRAHARDRARWADAHLRRDTRSGGRRAARSRRAP